MFVFGKPLQPSLMFAGKARAYGSEASFRCSTLGQPPGLTHQHYTKLERLAKDKHSSLLQKYVYYGCKKFYSTGPSTETISAVKMCVEVAQAGIICK